MMSLARNHELPTQAEFHRAIANRGDHWFAACLRITRSADLAADAVQDALLSAWSKRHQFERTARLETWIHRIAINAALQLLRKAPSFGHGEKQRLLHTLVNMDSDAVMEIIESTFDGGQ